ncbi:hypothetical protein LB515_02550 [Mesorhizobium sp. CA15]|uniref:hypothetical protein n=1 Tax=Mesorhizobium sp. CA15 TaxID=2876641 RepID=UPI001CD0EF89|nr:hypothetical protein [Mesorhizobium sp. CA15]MBZ9864247.1 hypothetical protein [Mesorhizobium sp. CA15]
MPLNALESAVLQKMLDGDHPVLRALRNQLGKLSVESRKYTGSGFFVSLLVENGVPPVNIPRNHVRFGDVHATIDGLAYGAGFILSIDHGYMRVLEGYSYEESWPENVAHFSLKYINDDRQAELSKFD